MSGCPNEPFEPKEVTLTWKGVSSVNWECSDSEFEFVFGKDRVCRVHVILAEFLSPRVARLRRCDISFDVYRFEDSEVFDVFESLVSSLVSGEAVRVEKSNFPVFLRLSLELENDRLLCLLLGMMNIEVLSLQEAIPLLRMGIDLGTEFSDDFDKLRDFVAFHFHEIERQVLDDIDLETSRLLLSSPKLQIEDEDSLYDFIRSRSVNDLRFTSLFEFIYFEYLSANRIEDFVSFVRENLLQNINSGIWRQICRRLILEANLNEKNPRAPPSIVYDESKKLDGIIVHLTHQRIGSVYDERIVRVTSESRPRNAVDPKTNSEYHFKPEQGPWICYEFKDRLVRPTSYSLRSGMASHLKSWVIEVSNDGTENSWTEIDRRDDNFDLNEEFVTANFKISRVPMSAFRFLRLRMTGVNHWAGNILVLNALEIFGSYSEK